MHSLIKAAIISILCSVSYITLAQSFVDSLEKVLGTQKGSARHETLYLLAKEYTFKDENRFYELANGLIESSRKLKDDLGLARGENLLGIYYFLRRINHAAFEHFKRAAELFEKVKDQVGQAKAYNNMGVILKKKKDFHKAIQYYFKSMSIHKENGNPKEVASASTNIGSAYLSLGNLDSAKFFTFISIRINDSIQNQSGIAGAYSKLASIMVEQENYDSALVYKRYSLKIKTELGYAKKVHNSYVGLAEIYRFMGGLDSAEKYGLLAISYPFKPIEKEASKVLANVYKEKGEFEKAVLYYDKYIFLKDSISEAEQFENIEQQEASFTRELDFRKKKEKERLEREEQERKVNLQYSIIVILILFVMAMFLLVGLFKVGDKVKNAISFILVMLVFEFLLVLSEPFLNDYVGNDPLLQLGANFCIALTLLPLHGLIDRIMKKRKKKLPDDGHSAG